PEGAPKPGKLGTPGFVIVPGKFGRFIGAGACGTPNDGAEGAPGPLGRPLKPEPGLFGPVGTPGPVGTVGPKLLDGAVGTGGKKPEPPEPKRFTWPIAIPALTPILPARHIAAAKARRLFIFFPRNRLVLVRLRLIQIILAALMMRPEF